jgi:hypothetical protein
MRCEGERPLLMTRLSAYPEILNYLRASLFTLEFKIDTMLSDLVEWKSKIGKPGLRVSLCVSFIDIWDLQ